MIGKTKKKILILGSEGQIGASLETHLKKKYIVTGIDILNHKSEDLRSKNSKIGLLIKNTDFVFFLAFDVGGSRYMNKYQNSYQFIMNNIQSICVFCVRLLDYGSIHLKNYRCLDKSWLSRTIPNLWFFSSIVMNASVEI